MGTVVKPLTRRELRKLKKKQKRQQPSYFADLLASIFFMFVVFAIAFGYLYLNFMEGG